ncbi:hypothetical protein AVEN_51099-1 [Araneus ventricosus]|uniref:Uncharacterized protein n=1 Tax=Araneus ventricosus TaxID=182803 RepID=A0A4Y2V1R5_ARAVE|nr:hypothetical protein AVEN_51099-1 [Araneus ventricosus]
MKRRTYQPRRQHRRESPHSSQHQETISRVCYKKSPSSTGKKNGKMEKQAGVFTTFYLKSRQFLLHGKGPKNVRHGPFPTYLKRFNIRNRQRFLRLRKPGKPLKLCYRLPVYNLIPPNKTVS